MFLKIVICIQQTNSDPDLQHSFSQGYMQSWLSLIALYQHYNTLYRLYTVVIGPQHLLSVPLTLGFYN